MRKAIFGSLLVCGIALSACSGGGGGNSDSTSNASSANSFITCGAPYQNCVEINETDNSNYRLTLPQVKIRIPTASFCRQIYYTALGSGEEKSFQASGAVGVVYSETKDEVTYSHTELPPFLNDQCRFNIKYGGIEIDISYWLIDGVGLANNSSYNIVGNFIANFFQGGVVATGETAGVIIFSRGTGKGDLLFPLGFETYGEQANVHDVICSDFGDCNWASILTTWLADYTFHIDY